MNSHPLNVLLIEDNEADRWAVKEAFKKFFPEDHLLIAEDGLEGLKQLQRKRNRSESQFDFVLLDLSLPRKDGTEILEEIKKDKELKDIPVFVWTSSQWENDRENAPLEKASACFVKPFKFDELVETLKTIREEVLKTTHG